MISFCAVWQAQGIRHQRKLIARFPANFELFLDYDPAYEWRAMEALAGSPVPVPPLLFHEPRPGRPRASVLRHGPCRGARAADDAVVPCHGVRGRRARRGRAGGAVVQRAGGTGSRRRATRARLPARLRLPPAAAPRRSPASTSTWIGCRTGTSGCEPVGRTHRGGARPPLREQAARRARRRAGGDARIGNVVFDSGNRVAALLDWEMAAARPRGG